MNFFISIDNLFIREGVKSILESKYPSSRFFLLNNLKDIQVLQPIKLQPILITTDIDFINNFIPNIYFSHENRPFRTILIANETEISRLKEKELKWIDALIFSNCSLHDLEEALGYIQAGLQYRCKKFSKVCNLQSEISKKQNNPGISIRESEIIEMLVQGKSTKEIADALHLSAHTVSTHRKNINRKLNLHSPSELTRWYLEFQ